ncbi:4-aminobutyrate--2-oxoglutarate transaminase [Caulobacter sp. 602-1]|uniref:4-aminobutyrate--2-oxoglutarate transaminase n=2 Tax=unclassified Caulobacter TaxID=2648921 RepID=UPI000F641F9F|nr:4-aminobutyrate--2-oxoglutarate transaminase [Caulobacter sp. 602-1]RRN64364.1 4-aminobutyrate--2-oxoglutarate transaminase [Caulobacter sp. 602-1]
MSAFATAPVSNASLLERRRAAVSSGVASSTTVYADRAFNAEIWDVEGRRYIDFAGGIAVLNVGHRHPRVMAAVQDQLERFTHTAFQVLAYEPYVALAERLNALAPIDGPAKTILFTSGAEAVENAVKIARAATGRPGVIAFTGAFHGRTTLSSALTGKVAPYKRMFGGAPANIFHAPFPIAAQGVSVEDSLKALDFLFAADLHPSSVAAIIIEPVQGEGGFHPAPDALMTALRAICDTHGILLIADEVQTGFGRTGKMFGAEHWSVRPDLITVAKSLAGGFPLSGVIGRASLLDAVEPGGLGGTYGGSPVACAAALAVLDVMAAEALCARADLIGARLRERIAGFAGRNDLIPTRGLRGPGAMIGFDVVTADGQPDGAGAKAVAGRALERGLILLTCGVGGETIRVLAPLTIPLEQLDEGLDILEDSLRLDIA